MNELRKCGPHPTNPCPFLEGGGQQCQLELGHEDDLFGTPHYWSTHLIIHERLGNGYPCSAVPETWEEYNKINRIPYFVIGS